MSFVVSDQGIGISQTEIPRIFNHFHQTDEGRKFGKQGTGLGLSLTKSFTEILGGRIEVQSERGVGSTFTVHLPVEGEAVTAGETPFAASRRRARSAPDA